MPYPKVSDPRAGLNESIYNAQVIVDAYSRGLEDAQCMSRLPIALYTQAEQHEARIKHTMLGLVSNPEDYPELEPEVKYNYVIPNKIETSLIGQTITYPNERYSYSKTRDWQQECIDCGIDIPLLDFDRLLSAMLENAEQFLKNILALFEVNIGNLCQVAYMMSFICIPDLIAILAMILAAILKLLADVVIGSFALAGFIMGVLMGILSALLKYILTIIQAALKPVACLIDAIAQIISKLPTTENIKDGLTEEELDLIGESAIDDGALGDTIDIIGEATVEVGDITLDAGGDVARSMKAAFAGMQESLVSANDLVQSTIDDIFGISSYMDCEPARSGTDTSQIIATVVQLMQSANMILSIIDRKSLNLSLDKICNPEASSAPGISVEEELRSAPPSGFSNDEIAEVIDELLGVDTGIVTDEDGEDVALIIKEESIATPKINLYGCNLAKVIEDYSLPSVIERADVIVEESLMPKVDYSEIYAPAFPSDKDKERIARTGNLEPSVIRKERIPFLDLPIDSDEDISRQIIPLDSKVDLEDTVSSIIRDLISSRIEDAQRARDQAEEDYLQKQSDLDIITEISKTETDDKIIKDRATQGRGIKDPDTLPVDSDYGLDHNKPGTDISTSNMIPATTFNKPIQLKCGSIETIEEQLSLFEDDK